MFEANVIKKYVKDIFTYRELIINLAVKDLKTKYKTPGLGFLWAILHPLLMMLLYSIVFSLFINLQIEKYPVFLITALLPWYFLNFSLTVSTTSIVDNANLIKKIFFPREIIPLSVIITNLANFLLSLAVLFIFLLMFKVRVTFLIIFLPLLILIQFILVFGISLFFSALHTYYRDVKYLVEILLLCWFYLTPVFYPVSFVPQPLQKIYMLNPMACLITLYRDILFYAKTPSLTIIGYCLFISLFFLITGLITFKKLAPEFADLV